MFFCQKNNAIESHIELGFFIELPKPLAKKIDGFKQVIEAIDKPKELIH